MTFLPPSFLLRLSLPCLYNKRMPNLKSDRLLGLPENYRLADFSAMEGRRSFADLRVAWNEKGIGVQIEVKGKENPVQGHATKPKGSDGLTLWIDTRDSRTSHRASRFCHQFHLLPTGGGVTEDQPSFSQSKIGRALQDAPIVSASAVPFQSQLTKTGYILEAFFSSQVLNGFDPEQNPRLGFFFAVRDQELGEQLLSATPEFPYWEDPSLWHILELTKNQ